ncbi:polysaccharide biosynthesis protein [Tumebacillus permanentifrigoris]|uniref:FlaA1/EpsC-like NDP-sugar epimerase n=1 Tax=Tumebacillus permanentifrigoris TaxID=378543 RepID=A0A316D7Y7_9BACL|nr:nucleoside-diphosphate sugar epimerase/dehydratase [Tumebacillus permanentifrigoris]PWK09691.1 FlaA1/EpsC-like NDP-sugar epimerase [Tumebacillus permanentifrigoris]
MSYRLRWGLLGVLDAFVVSTVIVLVYWNLLDFGITSQNEYQILTGLPYVCAMYAVITLLVFSISGVYRKIWEYASIGEFYLLFTATTIVGIIVFGLNQLIAISSPMYLVPRPIYLVTWLFTTSAMLGMRIGWRLLRTSLLRSRTNEERILIVGAGSGGALLARELKQVRHVRGVPVAFIDDDRSKHKLDVMGLPVVGGRTDIPDAVKRLNIQQIVIAMPSLHSEEIAKIINICRETSAKVKTLPRISDFLSDLAPSHQMRDICLEDLLGREPVKVDLDIIAEYLRDQVVLVTGAGGSIGSELCRQIAKFSPAKLLLLGHGENSIYEIELELRNTFPDVNLETLIADIQDRTRIENVFQTFHPSVVFHAAAHKHVPLMERNPAEAIKNNVVGTRNVAECAHLSGTSRFVLISSDKAVNPTSVMGVTKRVAEMIVQSLDRISETKFVAVRFGNVLGSRGSVIPVFQRQIREGGPVTVTHPDMVRYFMTIPEASQLVIQAGAMAEGGEIFILDMGQPVKIVDLARAVIQLSGLKPDVDIPVRFTGIRPGEKLFEELLMNEEGLHSTVHNRIFYGHPLDFDVENLHQLMEKLIQMAHDNELENQDLYIRYWLRVLVQTYKCDPDKMEEMERLFPELMRTS